MSSADSDPNPPSPPASSDKPPSDKPKKRRRWKRIFIIAICVVVILAIAGRVTIHYALPPVLRKVAGKYGFNASYDRMELYLLGGDVGLWGFKLTPKTGGEPVAQAEYCRADVSALNLLRGRLVVRRVEADGVDLRIDREADGDIPLLRQVMANRSTTPAKRAVASNKEAAYSLDAPLRVDQFRVSRMRVHWRDLAVKPNVDTTLVMTLRLNDLGSSSRPMHFLLDMTSPPLLDALHVEGDGTARDNKLDADISVLVRGIHAKPAAGYLLPLGLRPVADNIVMQMNGQVHVTATNPPTGGKTPATQPSTISGTIALNGITASADGKEAAGVDHVNLVADAVNRRALRFAKLTIEGVHAHAERTPDGVLRAAGFELVPAQAAVATVAAATRPAAASPTLASTSLIPAWSLGELGVRNVTTTFHDAAAAPATDLAFKVDHFTIRNLDSTQPRTPTLIAGVFSAPGVARAIHLDGSATPLASERAATIKIAVEGIRPDALRPYLEAAGIQSELKDAGLTCDLNALVKPRADGRITAQGRLWNINLTDGQTPLFAFGGAELSGLSADPAARKLRIDSIEITGPQLEARRDADGSIEALGFRIPATGRRTSGTVRDGAQTNPHPNPPPEYRERESTTPPPRLEIGKLTWKGVHFRFDDSAVHPSTHVDLTDAGVEIRDVSIDLNKNAPASAPGKIRAWLVAPGLAQRLDATGTLTPGNGSVAVDLDISGKGLDATAAAPYLKSAGIVPVLKDGSIQLHAHLSAAESENGLAAGLALENVKFSQRGEELLGVDALKVSGVRVEPGAIDVGELALTHPRARVIRQTDGSLLAAGVRIGPSSTQPAAEESRAAPEVEPTPSATTASPATASAPASPMVLTLGKLRITDGALAWSDHAVSPPVDTTAHASVTLDNLVLGKEAPAAKLNLSAALDQTLGRLDVDGTVSLAPGGPGAKLQIAASGIRQGTLASYLPPGTKITLKNGQLHLGLDAGIAPNPQGGQSAHLIVSGFDYADGSSPLLKFESAKAIVSRADLPGKVIAINELSVTGLETDVSKAADGSTRALGIALGATTTAPKASVAKRQVGGGAAQSADKRELARSVASPSVRSIQPVDVKAMIAQQRQPPPLITLDKLDINLKRVRYVDASQAGAAPITLADVHLTNPKRIELLGQDYASRLPTELDLSGKVDPVADHFLIRAQLSPFASQPAVNVAINVTGIKGAGAVAVAPELKEQVDGTSLKDGQFQATLDAQAKIARRSPAQWDFSHAFDASFSLHDVKFRDQPDAKPLAGVDEVRGDAIHADPSTGNVTVGTLEITKPIFHAYRDKSGIHAMGLTIKEPTTQPATTQPAEEAPRPQSVASEQTPREKPKSEYRINKLLVSGCDVSIEDRTSDPMLVIPITGLDIDARDLSNMCLYENRPVRFTALVSAGKVPLVTGKQTDLFSEIAASGNLSLYPRPDGWAKTSISGFEMLSLYGPAKAREVKIGGGTFDGNVDLRFNGNLINSRSKFAFTDLKIDEPSNGIIRRTLKLPTPLDAVIGVLQDASGAITVPLNLHIDEQKGVGGGQIAGQAVGAFASILATAMASAPLKVTGGVTQMVGLGNIPLLGGKKPKGPQQAGRIIFQPGTADPSAVSSEIASLITRMQKNKSLQVTLTHQLGGGDITRMAERANPSPEDARALAEQLRRRRERLIAERDLAAPRARAMLASDPFGASAMDGIARVRRLDRDLAYTEQAMDEMYDLLRPGADRQATRRTRAAAIDLSQVRLDEVRRAIVSAGIAPDRVRVMRPQFAETTGDAGGEVVMIVQSVKKP